MNREDELMEILKKSPKEFADLLIRRGVDTTEVAKELDMARRLVQERFGMNEENIRAVEFLFWFNYYVEKEVESLIVEPEVFQGVRREFAQTLVDKLCLGEKISVISELYIDKPNKSELIKLLRTVNDFRNCVAHGRFDNLKYKNYSLADASGQLVIIGDFMNALLN